mgnify:CR=1 FL=1
MSYTIEYNKAIFYIEKEGVKTFFLFIRQGDNNVRDAITNLRSKTWYLDKVGNEGEIWKHIGIRAGCVEGGGIQRSLGWEETKRYTIEEYIKQYRGKMKNAKPLEEFLNRFSISFFVYKKDIFTKQSEEDRLIFEKFIDKYKMREIGSYYYDEGKKGYRFDGINNFETLLDFLLNIPIGYKDDYYSGYNIEKFNSRRYYR